MNEQQLIADYADLGVSCGYIGNISRYGDDRSFRVFVKLATQPHRASPDVSVNVFDVPFNHQGVWQGPVIFDTPAVRAQLDNLRARLKTGKLHRLTGALAR